MTAVPSPTLAVSAQEKSLAAAASKSATGCARRRHSPATARIQRRLEAWELDHLRELAAEQAQRIEELEREVTYLGDCADMWQRSHHNLQEHLNAGTEDARAIGMTVSGELLVVRTEKGAPA